MNHEELPEYQLPQNSPPQQPPEEEAEPVVEPEDFRRSKRKKLQARLIWIFGSIGFILAALAIMASIKVTDWGTYQDKQFRVQMKYPLHWNRYDRPGPAGALVVFTAPQDTIMDQFTPNFSITVVPLSGKLTNFEQFTKEASRQMVQLFEKLIKVVEARYIRLAGKPSYRFIYVGSGKDVEDPAMHMHVMFQLGDRGYILTYAARKSQFSRHRRLVDKMAGSFKAF